MKSFVEIFKCVRFFCWCFCVGITFYWSSYYKLLQEYEGSCLSAATSISIIVNAFFDMTYIVVCSMADLHSTLNILPRSSFISIIPLSSIKRIQISNLRSLIMNFTYIKVFNLSSRGTNPRKTEPLTPYCICGDQNSYA